jgi:protoheme IX farnesyltransferase
MLPVVAGRARNDAADPDLQRPAGSASELPWALGFAGTIYGATAAICGALFLALAFQLNRSIGSRSPRCSRLFVFSIFYLFVLFAALLVDHGGDHSRHASSRDGRTGGSVHAELLPAPSAAHAAPSTSADEV